MAERLDPSWFVPQVGQGALALEVRRDDRVTTEIVGLINDAGAAVALAAERAFLGELGTGCSIPAGAFASVEHGRITLRAVMVAIDGSASVRAVTQGDEPISLGHEMARRLRDDDGGGALPGWHG